MTVIHLTTNKGKHKKRRNVFFEKVEFTDAEIMGTEEISEDDEDVRPNEPADMITQTAGASLRYGVSSTAAAAICSGFPADQSKSQILAPDKMYLAVDKSKVARRVCHENKKSLLIYGHP